MVKLLQNNSVNKIRASHPMKAEETKHGSTFFFLLSEMRRKYVITGVNQQDKVLKATLIL